MMGYLLPVTSDPWQVMTLDLSIGGEPFHAQAELRYLPAADQWFFSAAAFPASAERKRGRQPALPARNRGTIHPGSGRGKPGGVQAAVSG